MNTITAIKYLSDKYKSMCQLRDEVLRKPLGLKLTEEDKQKDAGDILIGCFEKEEIIACIILSKLDETTGKLRQMAVKENYQGKGIGQKVLQFAEQLASEQGYNHLTMHARKVAVDFYKKSGYTVCSEEFTEVGIPHVEMKKTI